MQFVGAEPSALSFKEIEDFADKIADENEFVAGSDEISSFAKTLGGELAYAPMDDYERLDGGSLEVYGPEKFKIFLSPITSPLRDNFTIGHELGHYFLHSGTPPGTIQIAAPRFGKSLQEQQANRFSASLLMPGSKFQEIAELCENDTAVLAGKFNVSTAAAKVRLKTLNRN
jgi:Zn-dependent peptidase ImmA (M78 family)